MCLYPKLIPNRKYTANKKNGGNIPTAADPRVLKVPAGCGRCIECMKQKRRNWQVRLQEEIRHNKKGEIQFVTLTFSNAAIAALANEINDNSTEKISGYNLDNEIATYAVRHFLERWRKKHGTSVKHWFTTELGHNGTENIHLHGLIWTKNKEEINNIWNSEKVKYGFVYVGKYVNNASINYIVKYITKRDFKHSEYTPKILTSPGIGANYTNRLDAKNNKYKEEGETKETYTTREGIKINLPTYYRNKIYTEEEREKLWIEKLDKKERWVCGERVDVSTKKGEEEYYKLVEYYRLKNKRLGYGNDKKNWEKKRYEEQRREMLQKQRIDKGYKEKEKEKEEKRKKTRIKQEIINDTIRMNINWEEMKHKWDEIKI